MAEPARQLPDESIDPAADLNDPDTAYVNGAGPEEDLEDENPDPDALDQNPEQDNQPYTKERHEQNVNDIKDFFGKNEPPDKASEPNNEEAVNDKQTSPGEESPTPPEAPPVIPPPKPGEESSGEAPKPESDSKNLEAATDAADKVKAGRGKFGKIINKAQQGKRAVEAGKDIKDNAKDYAKEVAKEEAKKAAKKYAKQLARQAGMAIKRAVVAFVADNPIAWAVIGIILLIIIIVVVIFVLFSFDGQGGKGPPQYPETALQKQQSNFLLAISGDKIASDTAVKEVIDAELARYDRVKTNADNFNPELTAGITAKKTELDTKLTGMLIEKVPERRKALRDQIQAEMAAFEATLPFGSWIAELAEKRVGQANLQFCSITGADAKVACASFTSTVLYLAGVPNPIVPSVDEIWRNSALQIVVDRPASASAAYYQANEAKLQPGDIIFWGNGACSPRGSVLFDHVGFYVGNGQAIDTSSSEEKVLKRSAASRDNCRVFNGARRYGR
ncbi:MAG: NlpC/P60 family protein [Patescibacteria group bacterium]